MIALGGNDTDHFALHFEGQTHPDHRHGTHYFVLSSPLGQHRLIQQQGRPRQNDLTREGIGLLKIIYATEIVFMFVLIVGKGNGPLISMINGDVKVSEFNDVVENGVNGGVEFIQVFGGVDGAGNPVQGLIHLFSPFQPGNLPAEAAYLLLEFCVGRFLRHYVLTLLDRAEIRLKNNT